jgi:aspartyl-tRNA(Asn)/glutamyl-tRNA(Gln) amidotransferase subunit B
MLMKEMGLSPYDAAQLCEDKLVFDFFQACVAIGGSPKSLANWITGPIRQYLNEAQKGFGAFPLQAPQLVALLQMVETGDLLFSQASQQLFPALVKTPTTHPKALATELGLVLVKDNHSLEKWVLEALAEMPEKVREYQKGKKGLIGLFVGAVKKKSKGTADPLQVTALLEEKLKK